MRTLFNETPLIVSYDAIENNSQLCDSTTILDDATMWYVRTAFEKNEASRLAFSRPFSLSSSITRT